MDQKDIKDIVNNLRRDTISALVGLPASVKQVKSLFNEFQDILQNNQPTDYINFLSESANGFSFNARVFCGIAPLHDPDVDYTIPDIKSYHQRNNDMPGLENKLLIGHADEDVYCFNALENTYEVLDRIDGMVYESFDTFEELFIAEVV
jgi:hypothetical protein